MTRADFGAPLSSAIATRVFIPSVCVVAGQFLDIADGLGCHALDFLNPSPDEISSNVFICVHLYSSARTKASRFGYWCVYAGIGEGRPINLVPFGNQGMCRLLPRSTRVRAGRGGEKAPQARQESEG